MVGNISQVGLQTAKSFRDLSSGFKFEVIGDGRVEQEIADKFSSPAFLETLDDRRVRKFLSDEAKIAELSLPESEEKKNLQEAADKNLGPGWEIQGLSTRGGNGITCLHVRSNEPGVGSQELYISHYETPGELSLTTTSRQDGWNISHKISGVRDGSNWMESANLEK